MADLESSDAGGCLRALAEPTRFAIVQLLLERHHCSRSLALALGISESAVSQHMEVLKGCGLVYGVRQGYRVHYFLNREALQKMTALLTGWLSRMDRAEECREGNLCSYRWQGCCCCGARRRAGCMKVEEQDEDRHTQ